MEPYQDDICGDNGLSVENGSEREKKRLSHGSNWLALIRAVVVSKTVMMGYSPSYTCNKGFRKDISGGALVRVVLV